MDSFLKRPVWRDYFCLSVVFGTLFFSFLGGRPLASPDEGRYVEIPREMVASNDYVTPHLNGLKYFEKPPLVYWVETAPIKLGFFNEFAFRFPIALFAILGCLVVYGFSRHFYSRRAGLWSAVVLATSLLYYSLSRIILLDLVLTVFITSGLLSFFAGIKEDAGLGRRKWLAFSAISLALAVLTKGLVGVLIPLGIMAMWITLFNKWRLLRPLYLPTNLFLFLAVALPWHILVSFKNPDFFDFYFIHEQFERYFTTTHRRYQPFWFFIPITILGFLPWTFFLVRAAKDAIPKTFRDWKIYDFESFLIVWIVFIFIFFSCSNSILIPYILPIFPALAILVGRFLSYVWKNHLKIGPEICLYSIFYLTLILGSVYAFQRLQVTIIPKPLFLSISQILTLWSISIVVLPLVYFWKGTRWALGTILLSHMALLFIMNGAGSSIQKPSTKGLAQKILSSYPKDVEVFTYHSYFQDLPVYLQNTVKVVHWSGELDFGSHIDPYNKIMLTDAEFEKSWNSNKNICVVTRENFYNSILQITKSKPFILGTQDEVIVVCNQRPRG